MTEGEIINATLRELPVGKIQTHTPNSIPERVAYYVGEYARLERENALLREIAARMAAEMREVDHEFCTLRDYDSYIKPL